MGFDIIKKEMGRLLFRYFIISLSRYLVISLVFVLIVQLLNCLLFSEMLLIDYLLPEN